ncbi:MAG: LysM peptidoglycan-binding domain-containing protein [Anaerolineales bacterium]|nr:LysM peptidoglycan-binding domain-containing protein [Anaerolineales bacterium]
MSTTRGDLVPAEIYETDEGGKAKVGVVIPCMFNPFEYTVSKTNSYAEDPKNKSNAPQMNFKKAGAQTLKLSLTFDTFEAGEDVSKTTRKLWKLMQPKEVKGKDKKEPPRAAFKWGAFRFAAVITNMTQKFTLFTKDGLPVRAKVDITFTQHDDVEDYEGQNPTSGGGPIMRTWAVVKGDRLDNISAEVYGDATKWRQIAEYNNLDNPLALQTGTQLIIPEDSTV